MKHGLSTLAYAIAGLALAACGGGSSGSSGTNGPSGASSDAFVTAVQSFIRTAPSDGEPLNVDNIALTTPASTEPTAIP